jgi:hypothetical protein
VPACQAATIRVNAEWRLNHRAMIRISISVAAFEALAATSPLGIVGCESELTPNGERLIWLEERWVNKLDAIRMPGES